MTKLLEDPLKPTWRSPLPFRAEPAPVTTTELFEESEALPSNVLVATSTSAPLEMTKLLPNPDQPTMRLLLLQVEPTPVTNALLFEEVAA